jgi:hypothetical protein
MPIGRHLVQCRHCGGDIICGDCITYTCRECLDLGHIDSFDCIMCRLEDRKRSAKAKLKAAGYGDIETSRIANIIFPGVADR